MIYNFFYAFINIIIITIYTYICGCILFEQKHYDKKSLVIGTIEFIVLALFILLAFDGIITNVLGCVAFCIYFKRVFNKNGILSGYAGMITQGLRLLPKLLYLVVDSRYSDQICNYRAFSYIELIVNLIFVIVGLIILVLFKDSFRKLRDLFLLNPKRLFIFLGVILLEVILTTLVRLEFIVLDNNFILDCVLCTILLAFMGFYFKDDYKLDDLSNHYMEMCEYTELNDRLINDYRVKLHDNKNHLLAIKSMTKDKKVINYIDNLVDFEELDSEEYLNELNRISPLSIRIFINYKLNKLRKMGVITELVVSDNLEVIPENDVPNVYTVIGIIMDNMIEYLDTIDNKLASIQIYMDNNHIIHAEFVNSYYGNINVNDLYKLGYSTKGMGRGVGLPIVKKIIDNNPKCDLETKVVDNYFVQHIKLDLKK